MECLFLGLNMITTQFLSPELIKVLIACRENCGKRQEKGIGIFHFLGFSPFLIVQGFAEQKLSFICLKVFSATKRTVRALFSIGGIQICREGRSCHEDSDTKSFQVYCICNLGFIIYFQFKNSEFFLLLSHHINL